VDAGVTVTVGDEDVSGQRLTRRGHAHVGRVVEGRLKLRPVARPQRHHLLPFQCVLEGLMGVAVGQVDPVAEADPGCPGFHGL